MEVENNWGIKIVYSCRLLYYAALPLAHLPCSQTSMDLEQATSAEIKVTEWVVLALNASADIPPKPETRSVCSSYLANRANLIDDQQDKTL